MNFKYKLPPGYSLRVMTDAEFDPLFRKHGKKIFNDDSLMYDRSDVLTKTEIAQYKKLRENFKSPSHIVIDLGLFFDNKFVGWSWGYQETPLTFYMCNSAVLPAHRCKGLYNCLMKEMLNRTTKIGFDKIYSRHMITNNDILIAKLKQGFKITHFELSETFGTMVHLSFYKSKTKNEILDFRSGHKRPTKKIERIFNLT